MPGRRRRHWSAGSYPLIRACSTRLHASALAAPARRHAVAGGDLAQRLAVQAQMACQLHRAGARGRRQCPRMAAITLEHALRAAQVRPASRPTGGHAWLAGSSRDAAGKPIRSLETPESQAALLVSDDPAETARTVGDDPGGPRKRQDAAQMLQRLAGDWQQRGELAGPGRLPGLVRVRGDARAGARLRASLVDERNLAWPSAWQVARKEGQVDCSWPWAACTCWGRRRSARS